MKIGTLLAILCGATGVCSGVYLAFSGIQSIFLDELASGMEIGITLGGI